MAKFGSLPPIAAPVPQTHNGMGSPVSISPIAMADRYTTQPAILANVPKAKTGMEATASLVLEDRFGIHRQIVASAPLVSPGTEIAVLAAREDKFGTLRLIHVFALMVFSGMDLTALPALVEEYGLHSQTPVSAPTAYIGLAQAV